MDINETQVVVQDNDNPTKRPSSNYLKRKLWRIGMLLVILGSIADFLALGFGSQSLIAPLGSLTLVSNILYAPWLLNEHVSKSDWISVASIVLGSAIAVMFGSHTDTTYEINQLFQFFLKTDFIIYTLIVSAYIILYRLYIIRIEAIQDSFGTQSAAYINLQSYHRFGYPSISGAIGSASVLFAKCFMELILNTIHNKSNMFVHISSYLVIIAMFGSITLQIKWLNDALKRFDASYCVPVFQSFWILLSVVSGLIFYEEYSTFTYTQAIGFIIGVCICILGVGTLKGAKNLHTHIGDDESLRESVLIDEADVIYLDESPFVVQPQQHNMIQSPYARLNNDMTQQQLYTIDDRNEVNDSNVSIELSSLPTSRNSVKRLNSSTTNYNNRLSGEYIISPGQQHSPVLSNKSNCNINDTEYNKLINEHHKSSSFDNSITNPRSTRALSIIKSSQRRHGNYNELMEHDDDETKSIH